MRANSILNRMSSQIRLDSRYILVKFHLIQDETDGRFSASGKLEGVAASLGGAASAAVRCRE